MSLWCDSRQPVRGLDYMRALPARQRDRAEVPHGSGPQHPCR